MKIDINKQYKTRDGRDVKIYTTEHEGDNPVVGAVDGEGLTMWRTDGRFYTDAECARDLIEVKPEQVVWVVVDDEGDATGWEHKVDALDVRAYNGGTLYRVVLTDDMVVE